MKKLFLFYIFLFLFNSINAQEIFFCKSISESGKPIDADIKWKIEPYGTTITILFSSKTKLDNSIYYLFIDKKFVNEFKPYDSKTTRPEESTTWIAYEYKFKEEGEFEIYVMNSNQKILATNHLTTSFSNFYNSNTPKEELGYSYYDNSKVIFCERVFTNKPYNTFLSTSVGRVYVYLDNAKSLNTDIILVYIYKKKNRAFEYDEFVESKKFRVEPTWNNTYFKYSFKQPGDYKILIYNKNEQPIKNGFLKVR